MTPPEVAKENVERLIALTERLTERLAVDSQAFEARRPHEAASRLEETSRLANLYRHESNRVKQDPSMIAGAPVELRAQLTRASEAFEAVLARHGRALYAAKTVTEGVVRAIAEEVAKQRTSAVGYGPGATPPEASGSAITLNRRA
jgi:hypothetical protein